MKRDWLPRHPIPLVLPLLLVLPPVASAADPEQVTVSASFLAASRPGAEARVLVTLAPRDPDVRVNQEPAPRLKLDATQTILSDRPRPPAPRSSPAGDDMPKYLDPTLPVGFPVALNPSAPKGAHTVKGTVAYFYCSKAAGWCRKGTSEVEIAVRVP